MGACQPGAKSGGASDPEHHALGAYLGLKSGTKLFSPDCAVYARAPSSDTGRVAVVTSSTGALRRMIDFDEGNDGTDLKGLAWSRDGNRLAARFPGDELRFAAEVHDVRSGSRIGRVTVIDGEHHPERIWFSADGNRLSDERGHSWPIVSKRRPAPLP